MELSKFSYFVYYDAEWQCTAVTKEQAESLIIYREPEIINFSPGYGFANYPEAEMIVHQEVRHFPSNFAHFHHIPTDQWLILICHWYIDETTPLPDTLYADIQRVTGLIS